MEIERLYSGGGGIFQQIYNLEFFLYFFIFNDFYFSLQYVSNSLVTLFFAIFKSQQKRKRFKYLSRKFDKMFFNTHFLWSLNMFYISLYNNKLNDVFYMFRNNSIFKKIKTVSIICFYSSLLNGVSSILAQLQSITETPC